MSVQPAHLLCRLLATPSMAPAITARQWTAVLAVAHAERLAGSLAYRLEGQSVPEDAQRFLDRARKTADGDRTVALWEAAMARRALAPAGITPILLKGAAYAALESAAAAGRQIGDLDVLVPRDQIDAAEAALITAGWEWVKQDAYDDAYYRNHMHELPPLIHRARDRMIDVHHTILPLTAKPKPDAALLVADAVPAGDGLLVLHPLDRLVHCAAHLFADGDLQGGLRNLWDFHCLLQETDSSGLAERGRQHGLSAALARAHRLCAWLFGNGGTPGGADRLLAARLLARDGWGRETHRLTRQLFYIRSHWLRMPPVMLAKHLWVKWRKGSQPKP